MNKLLFIIIIFPMLSFSQSLSDLEFGTDSTFDVVTWNIEWFPKNGTITVDSVSKIIKAIDADIIACQEIDDTTIFNAMLNNLDGYTGIYDPNNFEGLAYIFKTNTISLVDNYSLFTGSSFWRPFPRAPYLLNVIYQNETYILINNHLKCCGNGILNPSDINDEENRRLSASNLLETYISSSFQNANVFLIGDLNDELTDASNHNVFQPFFDAGSEYQFANFAIASGSSANWSYPSWPSHLDHILITNELFQSYNHPNSSVSTIKVDDYLPAGFSDYDNDVSDHRPVGLKLFIDSTLLSTSESIVKSQFMIYPNPTSNVVNVIFESKKSDISITIYNALGQIAATHIANSQSISEILDVSNLRPGIYFIVLSENNQLLSTQKLYIE